MFRVTKLAAIAMAVMLAIVGCATDVKYTPLTTKAADCVRNGLTVATVSMTTNSKGTVDFFTVYNRWPGGEVSLSAWQGEFAVSAKQLHAGLNTVVGNSDAYPRVTVALSEAAELCEVTLEASPQPA
jgi:hypothetical protein